MKSLSLFDITSLLSNRLLMDLPGKKAHEVMRAKLDGNIRPRFNNTTQPRPGGVLILFYEEEGVVKFPLIKRPVYVGAHSGQISLPGGKAEPEETTLQAALREGEEEIGVLAKDIMVLGTLTDFHVEPSNFMVTPVVGTIDYLPDFRPDPFEVDQILHGQITDLTHEDVIRETEIVVANNLKLKAPYFEINGEIVWGATAMILNELREILTR